MIYCDLCQESFSTNYSFTNHLEQQKHKDLVAARDKRQESANRSIFVTGFPRGIPGMMLAEYFQQFGPLFNPIIDRTKGVYAIIEFHEQNSVQRVLHIRKHFLAGQRLTIKPRRLKPWENDRRILKAKRQTGNEMNYSQIIDLLLSQHDVGLQMVMLTDVLRLTDKDLEERKNICQFFNAVFNDFFIFAEVNSFGSSANGLGRRGCDLDLLLSLKPECDDTKVNSFAEESDEGILSIARDVIERNYRKLAVEELEKLNNLDIIHLVKTIILKRGIQCSDIFAIPSKRCPIVRFNIQRDTKISVDLSVKNRLSLYNSKLVHLFMQSDERILPLTYTIKYWIYRRELAVTQANRLSSYSATLLVIFYLQNTNPPILPPVEKLRQSLTESRIQGGWECNFSDDLSKFTETENTESVSGLLKGFYDYYNLFDFEGNVVCPCTGKVISKEELKENIPNFNIKFICVQDPFDLSHNTTGNIDDFLTAKIFQAFSDAGNIFDNRNVFKYQLSGKPWGLISLFDNVIDESMNGSILDVKPDLEEVKTEIMEIKPEEESKDPDEHLKNNVKINLVIFTPCDIEYFKSVLPEKEPRNGNTRPEWFERVCKAVHSVFANALQFSCTPEDQTEVCNSGKRKHENENNVNSKRMRNSEGRYFDQPSTSRTSDDDWDEMLIRNSAEKSLTTFDRFVCHVYHRTWVGRKNAANAVGKAISVLQTEEMISQHIIGSKRNDKVLYSFLCKIELKPLPEIELTMIALSNAPELKSSTFTFLQSYVPKIIRSLHNSREVL